MFNFEKSGMKFSFRNPSLDQYGKFTMEYKVIGIAEKKDNDGYFYNSEFLAARNAMSLHDIKVDGKKFQGVGLPEDILKQVKNLFETMTEERKNLISAVIQEVVDGKRNITFSIVGCDYPHYQPWIENLEEIGLRGLEQNIMEKAALKYTNESYLPGDICGYLQRVAAKSIGTIEKLGAVLNPRYGKESQEYHGYIYTIVTSFDMKLSDILDPVLDKKKAATEKKDAIFAKAKETNEPQLIKQYSDECNDPNEECDVDIVTIYAMPDGSQKTTRSHTW